MTNPISSIPGVVMTGNYPTEPPMFVVSGAEKAGKSTLAISLFDWPNPGDRPLVIAWDPTGPDSCSKFGVQVPHIKIKDQPGKTYWDKARYTLNSLEQAARGAVGGRFPFGSILIDCASTMADKLHQDDVRDNPSTDPRKNYGALLTQAKEFMHRVNDLGVPVIWLAWLREPMVEVKELPNGQKARRQTLGGPNILGNFRTILAGRAHMLLILEKLKVGVGAQGADPEGYIRQIHTRTWENIEGGGRYTLPEPSPAHLGWILNVIMGRIPNPALPASAQPQFAPQAQPAPQGAQQNGAQAPQTQQ